MYKTLNSLSSSRCVLSSVNYHTTNNCEEPPKPASLRYLETMFFSPLGVPEQGKLIQSQQSESKR